MPKKPLIKELQYFKLFSFICFGSFEQPISSRDIMEGFIPDTIKSKSDRNIEVRKISNQIQNLVDIGLIERIKVISDGLGRIAYYQINYDTLLRYWLNNYSENQYTLKYQLKYGYYNTDNKLKHFFVETFKTTLIHYLILNHNKMSIVYKGKEIYSHNLCSIDDLFIIIRDAFSINNDKFIEIEKLKKI